MTRKQLTSKFLFIYLDTYEIALQEYLRWNYTFVNENCTNAGGGINPCEDIRICNPAVASLAIGGWPTLCGWVGKGVPKVCCGLPLVLGPALMRKVDEEKARKRSKPRSTIYGNINLKKTDVTLIRLPLTLHYNMRHF